MAAAQAAAQLNRPDADAPALGRVPLILRDLDTKEPFRQRAYRLQLKDKVIEGRPNP